MDGFRGVISVKLAVCIAAVLALLCGCIVDLGGALAPEKARMAPGLSGAWLQEDGQKTKTYLFTTRTGRTYTVVRRTGDARGALFQGVYLIPVGKPSDHTYVASLPPLSRDPKSPTRWLFVVKVYQQDLVIQLVPDERVQAIAGTLGVPVSSDNTLPLKTAREDAARLMARLAAEPFVTGFLFRRSSAFTELPASAASTEQAEALIGAGKAAAAVEMLSHMAARGASAAQFRLGQLVAAGTGTPKNPGAALWHFLDAHRSGHPGAAAQLAVHLQAANMGETPVFRTAV